MPSQLFSQTLGVPSHHVFLLSLNKVQYYLTSSEYVLHCSVLKIQPSSSIRLGHFLNYDFVSSHFPIVKEGSKKRFFFFWDVWLLIPSEHIRSLRKEFILFKSPSICLRTSSSTGTPCFLLGVSHSALQTRCSASHSASPITLWARKSALFTLFCRIVHWILQITYIYICIHM